MEIMWQTLTRFHLCGVFTMTQIWHVFIFVACLSYRKFVYTAFYSYAYLWNLTCSWLKLTNNRFTPFLIASHSIDSGRYVNTSTPNQVHTWVMGRGRGGKMDREPPGRPAYPPKNSWLGWDFRSVARPAKSVAPSQSAPFFS